MMSIQYVCKYCRSQLGEIEQTVISEEQLGFDALSPEEKKSILQYREDGQIVAYVICEHCQETLDRHPELSLYTYIHQ